ncbi:hypothetical protein [Castellaniella denitrificans]|uniref:Uncharacterized protein n=1 Tax=Castellaniella denitrificans TaxID=56119 RepID=A0ABT4M671_9BURK|nr:hypothetical protein [Castellaniella denitrificans]MCZ4330733.1 hypothetical protein [Castellaniella denitrificans]
MTTKTDITLPPLPPYDRIVHGVRETGKFWGESSMRDYARATAEAAVEADRQGRMPSDADLLNLWYSLPNPGRSEDEAIVYGRALLARYGSGQPAASVGPNAHIDDDAVDHFAVAMKDKLAQARAKGRHGWHECDPADLSQMLRAHVEKGDPRDVANFCMFLWSLGQPISAAPVAQEPVPYGVIVCDKRIPNALETFVPQRFFREAEWPDADYSKVVVYAHAQPSAQDREDAQRWRYWFQWFQSCDDPGEPAYPPDVDVIWHARPDMEFVEALDIARARGGSHA